MSNTINVSVEFYFQGERYAPSATIDLDGFIKEGGDFSAFHTTLAKMNGIDVYSYLFEVMQSEDLQFSNATGLAKNFLHDGVFDIKAFKLAFTAKQEHDIVQTIAKQFLQIEDIDQHSELKAALLEAYHQGQASH